jgi:hypothetical protein
MIQGAHASIAYVTSNAIEHWDQTLVVLDVENEEDLKKWTDILFERRLNYEPFYEPDIGNQLTALACMTDSKVFKKLPLAGGA